MAGRLPLPLRRVAAKRPSPRREGWEEGTAVSRHVLQPVLFTLIPGPSPFNASRLAREKGAKQRARSVGAELASAQGIAGGEAGAYEGYSCDSPVD